jgi:hypothetical protein
MLSPALYHAAINQFENWIGQIPAQPTSDIAIATYPE